MLGHQRLDLRDLVACAGLGLDEQVVDLRRHDVGVLLHERREDVRLADRVKDRLPGPVAAGQDQTDGRALVAGDRRDALARRSGRPRCGPGPLPGPAPASMWPASIAPIATPSMTRSRSGPGWIASPRTPSRIIASVGFERI